MAALLAACGGGDEDTSLTSGTGGTTGGTTTPTLTCDTAAFSSGATVPTSAQLTSYAKTYAGSVGTYSSTTFAFVKTGDATFVFKADGTATYKGAALDIKSVCHVVSSGKESMVLHWGTRGTAGANAFYDNHVDLFSDGTVSGSIGTDVFKAP